MVTYIRFRNSNPVTWLNVSGKRPIRSALQSQGDPRGSKNAFGWLSKVWSLFGSYYDTAPNI